MDSTLAQKRTGYSIPETLLYPRTPMGSDDFKTVNIEHGFSGTLKDFENKPVEMKKDSVLSAAFEFKQACQLEGVSIYCIKPKALPISSWETPKIDVKIYREEDDDDGDGSCVEYIFESLKIPEKLLSCFAFANLPILASTVKIDIKITFPCDTLVSTILCFTDGTDTKVKQLKFITEEFGKMQSGNILPFDFKLVSTLPGGGEPVPCHKFPIKMLLDGELKGDKLELPLSCEALTALKRVAYGDLTAIVDVEIPIARLVMGSGDHGPHLIPTGVLREFGIAAIFIVIGHLINSSILIEIATTQILAKNLFDCKSDVISWVLANGSPNVGLELYERIKINPDILNNFELKEPLLQVLMSE